MALERLTPSRNTAGDLHDPDPEAGHDESDGATLVRIPLKIQPGLNSDDTTYAASGAWADSNNVRFHMNLPQTIGGWESLATSLLSGVCRMAFPWTDNLAGLNVGFGSHAHLQVWSGGILADVTPALALPLFSLKAGAATVANGSPTVTVTQANHGLASGEAVMMAGGIGRILLAGSYPVTVTDEKTFAITAGANAVLSKTLANNCLAVEGGKPTVTVSEVGHNITDGTSITVSGAAAIGGVTPNGTFIATRIDADRYRFTFVSSATSTVMAGGGAAVSVVVPPTGGEGLRIAPQRAFLPGSVDGTGGIGFGTGTYSTGGYSEPSTSDYFPRTWAAGVWGQQLVANPRGGTVYVWENDTAVRAKPLDNAPASVTHMLVAPQDQVFALGCNEEVSGRFNPVCIRHSGVRKNTDWKTEPGSTAREYILPGGGRIVAGRVIGSYLLVWTNHSLFLGTFVGSLQQVWRFDRVAEKCGLIGPNAAVVVNQAAYWFGADRQFYRYVLGGGVEPIPCPIREDLSDNLTPSQADKIVASSNSRFSEIRFDYPDQRDGAENSRYVALSLVGQGWHRGRMARTAFVDAGPAPDPIGVTPEGAIYWHERGASADGQPLAWSVETADLYLSQEQTGLLLGLWPDFKDQIGPVHVTVVSRRKPQSVETVKGPFGMAVGDDKLDLRCSGRLFRLLFTGNSGPTFARLGEISVDVAQGGKR